MRSNALSEFYQTTTIFAIRIFIESRAGYLSIRLIRAATWHESVVSINIINVNIIHIECNECIHNYKSMHTIHEFSRMSPGYKISEKST